MLGNLPSLQYCCLYDSVSFDPDQNPTLILSLVEKCGFSVALSKEWLSIFYGRGRNNAVSVVLPCNPLLSSSACSQTLICTFLIILLYMQCHFF